MANFLNKIKSSAGLSEDEVKNLRDEVATLKKRIKHYEDEQETSTERSGKTVDTSVDSVDQNEIASLRNELRNISGEKATMELEFMNQVAKITKDSSEKVSEIEKKLKHTEQQLQVSKGQTGCNMVTVDSKVDSETDQLRQDLASADTELGVYRKDVEDLHKKIKKLERQKGASAEEVLELRREIDNEKKTIVSLNLAAEENDKHYKISLDKYISEIANKNSLIASEQEAKQLTNRKLEKLEGQRVMLLEEVTDLRMQLDRAEVFNTSLQNKMENMKENNGEQDSTAVGNLKQVASDAEDKVEELQTELREITKSYRNNVSRLEETVTSKKLEIDRMQGEAAEKDKALLKLREEKTKIENELEKERISHEELKHELTTVKKQHSAYERKSSDNIKHYVAEVDDMKLTITLLNRENENLKKELSADNSCAQSRMKVIPSKSSYNDNNDKGDCVSSVRTIAATFENNGCSTPNENSKCTNTGVGDLCQASQTTENLQGYVDGLERQLQDAKEKIGILHERLGKQTEEIGELNAEVASMCATRAGVQESARKEFQEELELKAKLIAKLETELAEAKEDLASEKEDLNTLRKEIHEMTSERLAYEECTMQAFEKRAATSQKTLQGELNHLKVEVTNHQINFAKMEKEYKNEIGELEKAIENLNSECDQELEEKQGEVDMIKYKLDEQMDMVRKLEKEREQLCIQMKNMSNTRRDELEDVQASLMETTNQNTSLKRALQALQMQVEHNTNNDKEMESLKNQVEKLKQQTPRKGMSIHKHQTEMESLRDENEALKERIRAITNERRNLQDRLKAATSDKGERSLQVYKDRNEKLRQEVDRLNKKLRMGQGSVT
eukprot:CAMPEP_0178899962 /NCGR_PEP_ID=MMETSP0786-20121207/3202_1 /TAXON_ID=186022 /ORGANISM="Thalassionema frauenfeldii, Strain CCMP 1798" /LENGTH=846 /DNA_ID=CAMNT_0020570899 /DNA_START=135 /DNA_END=2671 /DNA_ORIENTATION=+